MIEGNRSDSCELVEVVLVGGVVTVPSDHVEGAVVLRVHPAGAVEAHEDIPSFSSIFITSFGGKEVSVVS